MPEIDVEDKGTVSGYLPFEAPYTPPDINIVKQLHWRLLVRYIEVLNKVSALPQWVKSLRFDQSLPLPKFLISLFVESHIRTKLNELRIAYLYLFNCLPIENPQTKEAQEWLKNTISEIQKIGETLQSTTNLRGFLTLAWPYLLSAGSIALGIKDKGNVSDWLRAFSFDRVVTIIVEMYIPLFVAAFFISTTFKYKRALFLTRSPVETYEKARSLEQEPLQENIYALEDQLFDLLKRGKRKEFAFDFASAILNLILLAPFLFLGWSVEAWVLRIIYAIAVLWVILKYSSRAWR